MFDAISKKDNLANKIQAQKAPADNDITLIIINEISQFNQKQRKGKTVSKKKHAQDLNIFDYNVDLAVLEYIRQEIHKRKEPPLINICHTKKKKADVMLSNMTL